MTPEVREGEWIQGRWKLHQAITSGGMGDIYVVFDNRGDPSRGMLVAAKSFKQSLFRASAHLEQRFIQEAVTWVGLDYHPNVTAALYVDRIGRRPFLFLEYVRGGDLSQWLEVPRRLDDLTFPLRFAANVCDGMTFILSNGFQAHRDLTPRNCLLTTDGTLKITDFGIAKILVDAGLAGATLTPAHPIAAGQAARAGATAAGIWLGTMPYMAPEQFADASRANVRSDIYSFGIILYQMVTGKLPFVATTGTRKEYEYLHLFTAPPTLDFHPALSALIATCLAKNPSERFPDFVAIRSELEEIAHEHLPTPPVPDPEDQRPVTWKLTQIADSFQVLGRPHEALDYCEQALALDHSLAWAWTVKAKCLWALARPKEALSSLNYASKLDPKNDDAWRIKGGLLGVMGKAKKAVAAYDRALELRPLREEVWTCRGDELLRSARYGEALTSYERALELDGRSRRGWLGKAMTLAKLGRTDGALACVDRALELDPFDNDATDLRLAIMQRQ